MAKIELKPITKRETLLSLLDDDTYSFIVYLKTYHPIVYDQFAGICFLKPSASRNHIKLLLKSFPKLEKRWNIEDINVFQILSAYNAGLLPSKVWESAK